MGTMRIKTVLAIGTTILASLAAAALPTGAASAQDTEHGFSATVDQVLVNRSGGITVSGLLDCTAAVVSIYGSVDNVPDNTSVFVSKNWTATQYIGRGKVASASYSSGIASVCFTNDPSVYYGDVDAPWPWETLYAYPVGTTQWVYSSTGKFASGPIHVELTVTGDLTVGEGDSAQQHLFASFSGWDVRAVKVR
jgi:hypothetical protein